MSFKTWWAKWEVKALWVLLVLSVAGIIENAIFWPKETGGPSFIFLFVMISFTALVTAFKLVRRHKRH